jgi:hypothetical protein
MDLRCKVFRASDAGLLESSINHFLAEEMIGVGELQLEEITQSEGPLGVTITLWYSVVQSDEELVEEYESERSTGELA